MKEKNGITEINLKIKPFSDFLKGVPEIPKLVQEYLDKKEPELEGKYFKIVKDGNSKDTGMGMEYSDRLRIFSTRDFKVRYSKMKKGEELYTTGFKVWRPGGPHPVDRWDLRINDVKVIKETKDRITYGYSNGTGEIFIAAFNAELRLHVIEEQFNIGEREKRISNQKIPANAKEFKDWAYNLDYESRLNPDVKYDTDKLCIVLIRHANRSADYEHDRFRCFFWVKGKGVAETDWIYTNFPSSGGTWRWTDLVAEFSVTNEKEVNMKAKAWCGYFHGVTSDGNYNTGLEKNYSFKLT